MSERRVVGKWDRQQETQCRKPDRMEKEERAEGREGMNWDGTVPIFHATPTPPPTLPFKYREIYILSTQKCLNRMFSQTDPSLTDTGARLCLITTMGGKWHL